MTTLKLNWDGWKAQLTNDIRLAIFDGRNGGGWEVTVRGNIVANGWGSSSKLTAQLEAEAAAMKWLRQGLEAFGAYATQGPVPDEQLRELDKLAEGAEAGYSQQIAGFVTPMYALLAEKCKPSLIRSLVAAARELEWVKAVNAALFPYQERAVNAEKERDELKARVAQLEPYVAARCACISSQVQASPGPCGWPATMGDCPYCAETEK